MATGQGWPIRVTGRVQRPGQGTTDLGGHPLPSENGFRAALLIGGGVALAAAAVPALVPVRSSAAPLADPGPRPERKDLP